MVGGRAEWDRERDQNWGKELLDVVDLVMMNNQQHPLHPFYTDLSLQNWPCKEIL